MNKLLELLKTNKNAQIGLALVLGLGVGALFGRNGAQTQTRETMKQEYELKISEIQKEHSERESSLSQSLLQEQASNKEFRSETSHKLEILATENTKLKQSSKRSTYKLVKPDGTILEKTYDQSDSESSQEVVTEIKQEFDQKVASIESTWKKVHEERVAQLKVQFDKDLEKARSEVKTVEVVKEKIVTKKSLRPEIGLNTDKNVYLHASYPLLGPVTVGAGFSGRQDRFGEFHVGVGLDF